MNALTELQPRVRTTYQELARDLLARYPCFWSHLEIWNNEVFPIATSLTMNLTGPDRDEDLVLTARCVVTDVHLGFDSEISREDGQILASGPSSAITLGASEAELVAWVKSNFDSYFVFLKQNEPLVHHELESLNQSIADRTSGP